MADIQSIAKAGMLVSMALFMSGPILAQQMPAPGGAPAAGAQHRGFDPATRERTMRLNAGDTGPEAQEIIDLGNKIAAAVVRGDVAYVSSVLSPDFVMVHGDNWTTGGPAPLIDNKESFLKRVENKQYLFRDLDSVKVEMHGNVAITWGRYVAQNSIGPRDRSWFSVWFERVYQKQDGKWMFLSHKTVHGPTYGPDRASVADK